MALDAGVGLGDRFQEVIAHQALALLALGEGRPEDAIVQLEPVAQFWAGSTVVEPSAVPFVPDLIEAYVVAGARDEAAAWLARFNRIAVDAQRRWALAACARCEGLLAPVESLDEPFRRTSYFSDLAEAIACGFGADSYMYALEHALRRLGAQAPRHAIAG